MTLYGFLGGYKRLFSFKDCLIDNMTFRLHYQYTFAVLILASILNTAKQYFGDPIDCIVEGVPSSVFNSYCWIHGTFTLPAQLTGRLGVDFPHPGVGPYPVTADRGLVKVTEEGDEIRHAWYQWVVFVLFFQACCCYFPHFLWKSFEGGKIGMLLQDLNGYVLTGGENTENKRALIVNYFLRTLRTNNMYVFKFLGCEFLNLINIFGQMYLMDAFLGGEFSTYGSDVLRMTGLDDEERVDPMAKVFPKVSKCTFHKYGPSGTIVNHDGLCILPINIINEKIYIFLWFWFLCLICWTSLFFCFRIVTCASRRTRFLIFCGRAKSNSKDDISVVMEKLWFGDWFILMQLCKNMNPMIFHDLVIDLRDRMDPKRSDNIEMENGNTYPTLPLLEEPRAPYKEIP
ncbi:innexin inx2 isoform X2 [Eurytemora carolleeae]|uniref:innexin inx2 isoform X1 n=1 Tax=Eurytemora carolleeae TaxID=1294199 RepID=UPI000C786A19|nr:innexin inx2 isoform X1 [Eurytemora carolleeae]XP_023329397.1 innexin inx2 isoform X2 [Eurytemora carolleeae]|eukprot:XP_023329396.1 innexin inx2-like isoform X1 [Eurytemora affinis]